MVLEEGYMGFKTYGSQNKCRIVFLFQSLETPGYYGKHFKVGFKSEIYVNI